MINLTMPVTPSTVASSGTESSPPVSTWSIDMSRNGSPIHNDEIEGDSDCDLMFPSLCRVLSFYDWDDDDDDDDDNANTTISPPPICQVFSFDEWNDNYDEDNENEEDEEGVEVEYNEFKIYQTIDDDKENFQEEEYNESYLPRMHTTQTISTVAPIDVDKQMVTPCSSFSSSLRIVHTTSLTATTATATCTAFTATTTSIKRGITLSPINTDFSMSTQDNDFEKHDGSRISYPSPSSTPQSFFQIVTPPYCDSSSTTSSFSFDSVLSPTPPLAKISIVKEYIQKQNNKKTNNNKDGDHINEDNHDGISCLSSPLFCGSVKMKTTRTGMPVVENNVVKHYFFKKVKQNNTPSIPSVIFIRSSKNNDDSDGADNRNHHSNKQKLNQLRKKIFRCATKSLWLGGSNDEGEHNINTEPHLSSGPILTKASF